MASNVSQYQHNFLNKLFAVWERDELINVGFFG